MAKVNVRNRNANKKYKDGRSKPANWEYRFEAGKINGKRNQISQAGFKTKKEAEVAGAKALAEYDRAGHVFEPSEITVSDFLDYWIENYCEVNLSDNTSSSYYSIITKHIKPRIGMYKLKSVDTLILQELINAMHTENGFSKKYIKSFLKVIKGSFAYAKKTAKFISEDPSEDVKLPNMDVEEEEMIILSKKDIARILDRFKRNPMYYHAILIGYYTGLRVSEVFGLTWKDIDFEKKTLTINKIAKKFEYESRKKNEKVPINKQKRTQWYLGACKTKSSYRTIPIGDTLVNALRDLKELQEENRREYGTHYLRTYLRDEATKNNRRVQAIVQSTEEMDLEEVYMVCLRENGDFTGPSSMKYPSSVINNSLGIKYNFHALRHTHATMLIEQGLPIKSVSERLGHSNTRTTWDTYVNVTDKMKTDAVDVFEANSGLHFRDEELYALWKDIVRREKHVLYYKNNGIKICDEWKDYDTFEKYARENGYRKGLSLLRIDKSGDYEPDNCMFGDQTKSVKGKYVYNDGVNLKSYHIRQYGRSWGYVIEHHDEHGNRIPCNKAGFATEAEAALAAESKICELLSQTKPKLKLVK